MIAGPLRRTLPGRDLKVLRATDLISGASLRRSHRFHQPAPNPSEGARWTRSALAPTVKATDSPKPTPARNST